MYNLGIIIIGMIPVVAEAKEYKLLRELNQVTVGDTLVVAADFIEPARSEFVVRLVLGNTTQDRSLVVLLEQLQCARGGFHASMKHASFGVGERSIDLRPNETKAFTLLCETGRTEGGPFEIDIGYVLDQHGVLFRDITWTLEESHLEKGSQVLPPGFVPRRTTHRTPPPLGLPPDEANGVVAESVGRIVDEVQDTLDERERPPQEPIGPEPIGPEPE